MSRLILLISIILFNPSSSLSQLEKLNWHFGSTSKGLYFNSSAPFNPSVTNISSTPFTNEGCTVISSPVDGSLKFYTDGVRVVDASQSIMPNGSGLLGHISNFSNGASCQVPGFCDRFYVFSLSYAKEIGTIGELRYSIVDMSLPGNGTVGSPLGDVVAGQKNLLVTSGIGEGLEIIPKTGSHEYWLLVTMNGTNTINIYSVTNSGILLESTYNFPMTMDDVRCVRYCQNNDKIVVLSCIEQYPSLILDFDPSLGIINSTTTIPGTPWGASTNYWQGTFDGEWSPDGTKLYISKYRWGGSSGGRLYQYDLNLPLTPPIMIHSVSSSNSDVSKGLRLGPDGKIYWMTYIAGVTQNIHIVNDPNLPGLSCNLALNALNMGSNLGNTHLFPEFLTWTNSIPPINDTLIEYACQYPATIIYNPLQGVLDGEGDNLTYSVSSITGGTYSIVSGNLEISPLTPTSPIAIEIIYQDDFCFPLSDTFNLFFDVNSASGTLSLPDSLFTCNSASVNLDAGPGMISYLWSNGEITQTINVSSQGWYFVEATDGVCNYSDSTFLNQQFSTPINLGPDFSICANSYLLDQSSFPGNLIWSNGTTNNSLAISSSGQYSVIGENNFGCLSYDTIQITLNPLPSIDLGSDLNLCLGDSVLLSAIGFAQVVWQDGSTNDNFLASNTGIYSVTVTNVFGCENTDSVSIIFNIPQQINLGPDISLCSDEATLSSNGFNGNLIWNNGSTWQDILVSSSGFYYVDAIDLNGCPSSDSIFLQLLPTVNLNLGNDTIICAGEYLLSAIGYNSVLWSTGETTESISISNAGTYSVEVTNSFGCIGYDEIQIETINMSPINLGEDIITCSSEKIILSLSNDFGNVVWSTGQNSNSIAVNSSGTYWVQQEVCGISYGDTIQITNNSLDQVLYVPNAFTPDGNSTNNEFEVVFGDLTFVESYKLFIFDRWGGIVFYSEDSNEKWTGAGENGLVQDGLYVYKIEILNYCLENPIYIKYGHVIVLK